MESKTDAGNTGRYERREENASARQHRLSFLSEKWLQHGSKEDIFADADLSTPKDLHQQITRATNILDSLVVIRLVEL